MSFKLSQEGLMRDFFALSAFTLGFWKKYWRQETLLFALLIALLVTQLLMPIQVRHAIDSIFQVANDSAFGLHLLFLSGLVILSMTISWAFNVIAAWVGESLIIDITSRTYSFVLSQRRSFWQKFALGDVLTRLTQDILSVKSFSVDFFHTLLFQGISLIGTMGVLFYMSPRVGFLILLCVPLAFALTYWSDVFLGAGSKKVRQFASMFMGVFKDGLSRPGLNFSWNTANLHLESYKRLSTEMRSSQVEFINRVQGFVQGIGLLNFLTATIGVLWILQIDYRRGLLSPGEIFALAIYSQQATQNAAGFAKTIAMSKMDRVAVMRIREMLDFDPPSIRWIDPSSARVTHPFLGGTLRDGIQLPGDGKYLFRLHAENGAGKTTLSHILSSYDDLAGIAVSEPWFLIPNDPHLFPGDLLSNIQKLTGTTVEPEEISATLQHLGLLDLLSIFPNGWSTILSNQTEVASSGQKQAAILIAAVVRNPSSVFVDEGLNSLDDNLRKKIEKPLASWLADRRTILVEHSEFLRPKSMTVENENTTQTYGMSS